MPSKNWKFRKKVNNEEKMIFEEESKDRDQEAIIINSNDEVKYMKEIDQKYSKLNKRAINEIKHSIKYDSEIVVMSEQFNGKKINIYKCIYCKPSCTIKNDKAIIIHMIEKHELNCEVCKDPFYRQGQLQEHIEYYHTKK